MFHSKIKNFSATIVTVKKIIVASKNPVKINATQKAFEKMFPDETFEIEGISADSGVSDQPMTEKETLQGAHNRCQEAQKLSPQADYWVGIEGGLENIDGEMEAFAWICIYAKDGQHGRGRTGSFFLPDKVTELINQGMELGEADDIVFQQNNSKQKSGSIGILTRDVIDRTQYYEPAVIMALIPFANPNLY
ncbi:inosine/xanthosine triphosphatase [candidate division WWE3 bacterium]|uniref:Probable inosine/xanthosine triphosphatase n=1 Tax=candidate division WWE3 bacterium TaxID=2053526 RepID=A0A955LFV4_UNCKA|nr:inosine/xanthosine triphosphatase [candidate division WWE3 bacterium]